jgi:uncharacterized membrane protein
LEADVTARVTLTTCAVLLTASLGSAAGTDDAPLITVREIDGAYAIAARFTVAAPGTLVSEVLTDYDNIPRFMTDVRRSVVLERQAGFARVEQEAVSHYMMFSKRVHLVLDIEQGPRVIRFRNRCTRSFAQYEGAWTLADQDGVTEVTYELTAQPAFGVPGFVLRKLLNRDAAAMIDQLRAEISARASK